MEAPLYLSASAIVISFISLAWAIHIGRRDCGKLKAISELYYTGPAPDGVPSYLEIRAVNHGRRPVILTMLGVELSDGTWSSTYLKDRAVRLGENEALVRAFQDDDYYHYEMSHEGKSPIDLCFEDTLGRRYRVKNAKEHLKTIWGKRKEN